MLGLHVPYEILANSRSACFDKEALRLHADKNKNKKDGKARVDFTGIVRHPLWEKEIVHFQLPTRSRSIGKEVHAVALFERVRNFEARLENVALPGMNGPSIPGNGIVLRKLPLVLIESAWNC